jgi:hypothetical protein
MPGAPASAETTRAATFPPFAAFPALAVEQQQMSAPGPLARQHLARRQPPDLDPALPCMSCTGSSRSGAVCTAATRALGMPGRARRQREQDDTPA